MARHGSLRGVFYPNPILTARYTRNPLDFACDPIYRHIVRWRCDAEAALLKSLEKALKASGDETRLRILKMLEPGSLCVCQIVEALKLSQSTVSKHLSVLEGAGLVEGERRGRWTHYRLSKTPSEECKRLLSLLRCCASQDPTVAKDLARVGGEKVQSLVACCPPKKKSERTFP
jgi:ArsR family transcriptional regulator, arsenate/arsenite/antimonite-responsive transcriptional repressor